MLIIHRSCCRLYVYRSGPNFQNEDFLSRSIAADFSVGTDMKFISCPDSNRQGLLSDICLLHLRGWGSSVIKHAFLCTVDPKEYTSLNPPCRGYDTNAYAYSRPSVTEKNKNNHPKLK